AHPGTLHFIPPNLCAFEPAESVSPSTGLNTLLWVGGMFDTLLSVQYPLDIAQALPSTWTLLTASLGSAGKSWGVSSIAQDAEDMATVIAYAKKQRPHGKVVIMGHSTGCQDCMEYLVGPKAAQRPAVSGVILQAPVSDREALNHELPEAIMHEANQLALKMCREGHDKDAMPHRLSKLAFGRMAITARRWVDVASPGPDHTGADDYFSSDLSDERLQRTFGTLPSSTPLLILYSGNEENIPPTISKEDLISRWTSSVQSGGGQVDTVNGGIVAGATHNLNGNAKPVIDDLVRRVIGFLNRLD
ncbi:hypothetical protein BAUCODRAFT_48134, partial [Baudoinia panamericana UAMH 10762]